MKDTTRVQLLLSCLAERLVKLNVNNVEDEYPVFEGWAYEVEAVRVGRRVVVRESFRAGESKFYKLKTN